MRVIDKITSDFRFAVGGPQFAVAKSEITTNLSKSLLTVLVEQFITRTYYIFPRCDGCWYPGPYM